MPFNNQAPNIQPSVKIIPAVRNENMVMIVPTAPAIVNKITTFEGIRPLPLKKLKIALNKIPQSPPRSLLRRPDGIFSFILSYQQELKAAIYKEAVMIPVSGLR